MVEMWVDRWIPGINKLGDLTSTKLDGEAIYHTVLDYISADGD